MVDATPLMARNADWFKDHLERYLVNGNDAHFLDCSEYGGQKQTPTLVIRTIGRKSGKEFLIPLVYMPLENEYIIAASKGGHDEDPQWYLNLKARSEIEFKVRNDCYAGSWRILQGEERTIAWNAIVEANPFYGEYERITPRIIPLIALKAECEIEEISERAPGDGNEAFNR